MRALVRSTSSTADQALSVKDGLADKEISLGVAVQDLELISRPLDVEVIPKHVAAVLESERRLVHDNTRAQSPSALAMAVYPWP